jgi:glycosyltransferase involved in cell wall biosynthesis
VALIPPLSPEIEDRGTPGFDSDAARPCPHPARSIDGTGLVIVGEQMSELGGTERVMGTFGWAYQRATLVAPDFRRADVPPGERHPFRGRKRTAWTAQLRRQYLSPLYSWRTRRVEPDGADVVLSMVSHGWSMAARVPDRARHLVYYTGPSPSLYTRSSWYLRAHPAVARPFLRAAMPALRAHNRRLVHRADRMLSSSSWAADEIARLEGRRSEVLHPPVRTDFFTVAERERRHLLFVARLVPHKRLEDVIEAFRSLDDELVVVGHGPLLKRLPNLAPPNVRFTGYVDDAELRELYRSSRALICPSIEEFGIVMAEAQACGTPVIAPRAGGALDIVHDEQTGLLLDRIDPRSLAAAVRDLDRRSFDQGACAASAERFSEQRFIAQFDRVLAEEFERAANGAGRRSPIAC